MLLEKQIVKMRNGDLRWKAGIDGAAAGTGTVHLAGSYIRVNNVFRAHTQAFQISAEKRRICIETQYTRNPDAQLRTPLSKCNSTSRLGAPCALGLHIGNALRMP